MNNLKLKVKKNNSLYNNIKKNKILHKFSKTSAKLIH